MRKWCTSRNFDVGNEQDEGVCGILQKDKICKMFETEIMDSFFSYYIYLF